MIPIQIQQNKNLAKYHYQALRKYLEGKMMKNKFARLEELIKDFTNKKYDFEKLVTAPFSSLKNEIIPLWMRYPISKRNGFKNSIKLFENLYSYLGKPKYYSFVNEKNELVYYNTYYLFKELNIRICPYCNENYTYHFDAHGNRNYDMDHFFSQKDYPIAAICFFNLVPSCKVCNFFKLDKDTTILSPYEAYRINETWSCKLSISSTDYLIDTSQFAIVDGIKDSKLKKNIEVFDILNRYNERKDLIADILKKKQLYNSDYIDQLLEDYEGILFNNTEDIKNMIFGTSLMEDEFSQRPFSKLIFDIFHSSV